MKKIICVDFDGVIHSYESGWKGATVITDKPVEGAISWLEKMCQLDDFEINIYSSRSKEPGAVEAMKMWLFAHGMHVSELDLIGFPTQKPSAWMTIDDRAFCFKGKFPNVNWLRDFKPWNKK
jgi:hypothetical protein